jgi:DNA-binding NtrC family response regulator
VTLHEQERAFRAQIIRDALQRHHGNRSATARDLGISRRHIARLLLAIRTEDVTKMSK